MSEDLFDPAYVNGRVERWRHPGFEAVREAPFRIKHAVILIIGFFLMQFLAGVLFAVVRGVVIGFEFGLAHGRAVKGTPAAAALSALLHHPSPASLIATIIGSYLLAALWAVWYVRRRSGCATTADLLARVGYRRVGARFYGYAAGIALFAFVFICALTWFIPPHHRDSGVLSAIGHAGPVGLMVIAGFSVIAFPLAEEFLFRGVAFKALQSAMRPGYAAAIVTAVFVLAHAPEKIHYPLGFLAVGVLAVGAIWLRIKSNSVWPPTLLHALYNAGVIIAAIVVGMHRHMV